MKAPRISTASTTLLALAFGFAVGPPLFAQTTLVNIPNGPNPALPSDPLNEDKAVFNVSTFDDSGGRWFYFSAQNQRILANYRRTNGTWLHPTSRVAIEFPIPANFNDITIALGTVLASATNDFRNPVDGLNYKRVMYFIFQGDQVPAPPGTSTGAGVGCAAFSNDGWTWVNPVRLLPSTDTGAPVTCSAVSTRGIRLEAISGARSGGTFLLAGLEGDFSLLTAFAGTTRTLTYLFSATPAAPHRLLKEGEFPSTGMYVPTGPGGTRLYYFPNLDFSYDPTTDKALLLRAFAYPFKFPDDPSRQCNGVCPEGLATFPLRGQMYSQKVNGNPRGLLTGTWKLEFDVGRERGWPYLKTDGTCSNPYPYDFIVQQNIGLDMDSINVHKQMDGFVARDASNQLTYYLGGYQDRYGSCISRPNAFSTFLDGALYSYSRPLF